MKTAANVGQTPATAAAILTILEALCSLKNDDSQLIP